MKIASEHYVGISKNLAIFVDWISRKIRIVISIKEKDIWQGN